jgi:hypothetical protein
MESSVCLTMYLVYVTVILANICSIDSSVCLTWFMCLFFWPTHDAITIATVQSVQTIPTILPIKKYDIPVTGDPARARKSGEFEMSGN